MPIKDSICLILFNYANPAPTTLCSRILCFSDRVRLALVDRKQKWNDLTSDLRCPKLSIDSFILYNIQLYISS